MATSYVSLTPRKRFEHNELTNLGEFKKRFDRDEIKISFGPRSKNGRAKLKSLQQKAQEIPCVSSLEPDRHDATRLESSQLEALRASGTLTFIDEVMRTPEHLVQQWRIHAPFLAASDTLIMTAPLFRGIDGQFSISVHEDAAERLARCKNAVPQIIERLERSATQLQRLANSLLRAQLKITARFFVEDVPVSPFFIVESSFRSDTQAEATTQNLTATNRELLNIVEIVPQARQVRFGRFFANKDGLLLRTSKVVDIFPTDKPYEDNACVRDCYCDPKLKEPIEFIPEAKQGMFDKIQAKWMGATPTDLRLPLRFPWQRRLTNSDFLQAAWAGITPTTISYELAKVLRSHEVA